MNSYLSKLLKDEKVIVGNVECSNPVMKVAVDTISGKNTDLLISFIKGKATE